MAKSLNNSLYADELLRRVGPATLRYYLLTTAVPWTIRRSDLTHTEAAVTRIATFQHRARTRLANTASDAPTPPIAFAAALDDLNVPAALAVLHDHVRAGNIALDNGDPAAAMSTYESVLAMTEVLDRARRLHDRPASRRSWQHDLYPRRGSTRESLSCAGRRRFLHRRPHPERTG